MKYFKNILLVIAALCCVTFAHAVDAEAQIYGRLAVQADLNRNSNNNGFSIQDGSSYFGLKGRDRLYGNNYLTWQIENFLNLSTGAPYAKTTGSSFITTKPGTGNGPNSMGHQTASVNTFASSDTFIGLQGVFGEFRFGNLSNSFRTNTGAIDIFSGNGSAGYQNYDNVMNVLPGTIKYNSPTWGGFNFIVFYSPNNVGAIFNDSVKDANTLLDEGATNGYYGYGLYGGGLSYSIYNLQFTYNMQVINNVGEYNGAGMGLSVNKDFQITPFNAWAQRIEVGWQDPVGMILGFGAQLTNGYAYSSWAGNFGASSMAQTPQFSKYKNANQLQTAEAGLSFGWHIKNWTPKISYVAGTNVMDNQSNVFMNTVTLQNQISGTWYNQVLAELAWSITPKTIGFVGAGQIWWGGNAISSGWQNNQGTATVGFSHVF
jgi:predicted porin